MSENILRLDNITMQFGGVIAVNDLSLEVNKGEIVALIGPNGAGKTTAFNCVTGVYQPTNGRIEFLGNTIVRNHPRGKMAKEYLGSHASLFTAQYDGMDDPDVLKKIVAKCNANEVDLDVSIHFNGGRNDYSGDGKTGGTEVFIYSADSTAASYAAGVADAIADLGYTKRKDNTYPVAGVKVRPSLYVLKHTKAPAMLVECCFTDDKDDVERYEYKSMASAIVRGITGTSAADEETPEEDLTPEEGATSGESGKLGRIQFGAYRVPENAKKELKRIHDAGFTDAIIVWS